MSEELVYGETILIPDGLHEDTAALVIHFAEALAKKLYESQKKYNYQDEWMRPDWMDTCRAHLRNHLEKGDPRDVAAYCAFLWFHQEPTIKPKEFQQVVNAVNVDRVNCSNTLRKEGKPYPRTCPVHGLLGDCGK